MKRFKQFLLDESIGDVWRSVARHLKQTHPDLAHHFAHENLDHASEHYHKLDNVDKDFVMGTLQDHSHYHKVDSMFASHYKGWKDKHNHKDAAPTTNHEPKPWIDQAHRQWFHTKSMRMIKAFDNLGDPTLVRLGVAAQTHVTKKYNLDDSHDLWSDLDSAHKKWTTHKDSGKLSDDINSIYDRHLAHHHV